MRDYCIRLYSLINCLFVNFCSGNLKNLPYVVITNNTKTKSDEFLANLRQKGLNIKSESYLDPFCVLNNIIAPCAAALFGADEFIKTMQNLGFTQDLNSKNAVLVASYDDFKFSEFANMIELILAGAKFIPLHETSIYKKNGRLYPGVGAVANMIKTATNCEFKAVGKPSLAFYEEALRRLNLQKNGTEFSDITIVSDDALGDLKGAKALGMKTALVLSGKVSEAKNSGVMPEILDFVFKDVSEFLGLCVRLLDFTPKEYNIFMSLQNMIKGENRYGKIWN